MKSKRIYIFPMLLLFFSVFPLKTADFEIYANHSATSVAATAGIYNKNVIPGGKSIGVTLNTDGVTVTGVSEILCNDGSHLSPAKDAGLKPGDIIKEVNKQPIGDVSELCEVISTSNGDSVPIMYMRNNKNINAVIKPLISKEDGKYKIGAWVKDATSGIGTLTFYEPDTKIFAALGHGICNPDSGELLQINGGNLLNSTVIDINKSQKGSPGELKGIFAENGDCIGTVHRNSDSGISGEITTDFQLDNKPVPIAPSYEIMPGKAQILTNIEGERIDAFDVKIIKIVHNSDSISKNMIIEVTDRSLIEKTGGIVQGMSGSPILQNGRIVGAVTHVFVNDPTRGYGIFIENMLAEAEKIK